LLEGPAEQRILRAGQWLADLFAYRRINKRFANFTRSYLAHNAITRSQLRRANLQALRESWLVRRRPLSFTTLRFYAIVLGELSSDTVDELEYWQTLHRKWGGRTRAASDAKTLTRKLLGSERIPDIGYFVNGSWFDTKWQPASPASLIQNLPEDEQVVLKADYSERGQAVQLLTRAQFLSPEMRLETDSVLQRKVQQHPFFSELRPESDATVRLVTAYWAKSDSPRVLYGLVKWDVLGFDHVSRIKVDTESGVLVPPLVRTDWKSQALPDQFNSESALLLPGFQASVDLVLGLHASFPHYQLIGWDLGIDRHAQPWIFEWNADHPAIFTGQVLNGPILAEGKRQSRKKADS